MARGKAVSLTRKIRTKQFSARLNVSVGLLNGASFVNFCTLGQISWQNFTHDHDKIEPRVTEPCKEKRNVGAEKDNPLARGNSGHCLLQSQTVNQACVLFERQS